MQTIINEFSSRTEILLSLIKQINVYFEYIVDITKRYDINNYTWIITSIKKVTDNVMGISATIKLASNENNIDVGANSGDNSGIDTANYFLSLYSNLTNLSVELETIMEKISDNKYVKLLSINMSQTYSDEIYRQRAYMYELIGKYKDRDANNEQFFTNIYNILNIKENYSKIVQAILNNYYNGKLVVYIITQLLHIVSKQDQYMLLQRVEQYKSEILDECVITFTNNYPNIQRQLLRHHLVNLTPSMPLPELFKTLSLPYDTDVSDLDNIEKIGGIVLINDSAIEFNIMPLINLDYVMEHDLMTNPKAGINKKNIHRYNTVYKISEENATNIKRPDIIVEKRKDTVSTTWIFESLADKKYRLLSKNASEDVVKSLLNNVSMRADKYNKIMSNEIVANCMDVHSERNIRDYIAAQLSFDTQLLKEAIVKKFATEFANDIDVSIPTTYDEFINIGKSPARNNKVISFVIFEREIRAHIRDINREYRATMIYKVSKIIQEFNKHVLEVLSNINLPVKIFREKEHDDLIATLINYYKDVIIQVVEDLDNEPSMWKSIEISFKEFVINKNFIQIL